jgi:hypothetical protein
MEFKFPKEGEIMVCERCYTSLKGPTQGDADGDLDFPFCPTCLDMVDGKIVPISKKPIIFATKAEFKRANDKVKRLFEGLFRRLQD